MTEGSNDETNNVLAAARLARFGRDIGVNVLANLIAAAIVYLLGAGFGLLPNRRGAIYSAISVLVAVAAAAIAFLPERFRRVLTRRQARVGLPILWGAGLLLVPYSLPGIDPWLYHFSYLLAGLDFGALVGASLPPWRRRVGRPGSRQ